MTLGVPLCSGGTGGGGRGGRDHATPDAVVTWSHSRLKRNKVVKGEKGVGEDEYHITPDTVLIVFVFLFHSEQGEGRMGDDATRYRM